MKNTLVLADNELAIRRFCKLELEGAGYRVLLANDGEDALDIVATFFVDLAILDEHMPRCSGLDAARRIKQRCPTMPVILFTADGDYAGFRHPCIDAAVIKSEDLNPLKTAIDNLLSASSRLRTNLEMTVADGPRMLDVSGQRMREPAARTHPSLLGELESDSPTADLRYSAARRLR